MYNKKHILQKHSKTKQMCIRDSYKTGELSLLDGITTDKDEAFSLLSLGENETYVDLGAYNGDTVYTLYFPEQSIIRQ